MEACAEGILLTLEAALGEPAGRSEIEVVTTVPCPTVHNCSS
jgi:hypothetical protein